MLLLPFFLLFSGVPFLTLFTFVLGLFFVLGVEDVFFGERPRFSVEGAKGDVAVSVLDFGGSTGVAVVPLFLDFCGVGDAGGDRISDVFTIPFPIFAQPVPSRSEWSKFPLLV